TGPVNKSLVRHPCRSRWSWFERLEEWGRLFLIILLNLIFLSAVRIAPLRSNRSIIPPPPLLIPARDPKWGATTCARTAGAHNIPAIQMAPAKPKYFLLIFI